MDPAGVKPYKQKKTRPPGHVRCPYCNEFYPLNEINAHKAGCPKNVYQMGAPKNTKLTQTSQEDQPQSNRCPSCGNIISDRNTGHTRYCPSKIRVQTGRPQSRPPEKTGRLLIDEYGVVRTYSAWLNDQNEGENQKTDNLSPLSSEGVGVIFTTCQICGVKLKHIQLSKHMSIKHSNQTKN